MYVVAQTRGRKEAGGRWRAHRRVLHLAFVAVAELFRVLVGVGALVRDRDLVRRARVLREGELGDELLPRLRLQLVLNAAGTNEANGRHSGWM